MIKDLRDWQNQAKSKNKNKHQWGWFQNPNAGNVKYNMAFFNHVTGADGGDTSVLAGSVGEGGIGESLDMKDVVELYYDDIEVSGYYGRTDWETGYPEKEYNETIDWTYTVDKEDIVTDLIEIIGEEYPDVSEEEIEAAVRNNFDLIVDRYYTQLLDRYRDAAEEEANEKYEYDEYGHYLDAIGECINVREALNRIDCDTCNEYDLLNTYDAGDFDNGKKVKIAEMIKSKVSASKLYEYMNDNGDWQVGMQLYVSSGESFIVTNVVERKDVAGREVTVVGAIGNDTVNAEQDGYFVLVDEAIVAGPFENIETAVMRFEDVTEEDIEDVYEDDIDSPLSDYDYEEEWSDADDVREPDFYDLYGAHGEYEDDYAIQKKYPMKEDTVKQGNYWVNKGKAGTHGRFATKRAADAQRKAMFANGYKESIKKACRRGNAMNEGAMKEIDLEIQEAGGVDAYIDSLESQLRNISREMRFLRGQARREIKAGGAYDSVDEINDALRATEKEYNEVRKKYDYISSRQTGRVD